ncbi:hypothetical protein ABPG75_001325 [Micractinium tetrahymenae]
MTMLHVKSPLHHLHHLPAPCAPLHTTSHCSVPSHPLVPPASELEDPGRGFMVGGALTIPITVELSFRRLDMPPKERGWLRRVRQRCWQWLRSLAALLLNAVLLLLLCCTCIACFHCTARAGDDL